MKTLVGQGDDHLDIYSCMQSVSILGGELVDAAIGWLDVQGQGMRVVLNSV